MRATEASPMWGPESPVSGGGTSDRRSSRESAAERAAARTGTGPPSREPSARRVDSRASSPPVCSGAGTVEAFVLSILGSAGGRAGQGSGGVDERHMAEGLREVADQSAGLGVVLLGEESDVVAQGQQPFEDLPGLVVPALEGVVVREPESAREKGSLAGRQTVDAVAGHLRVALHEVVLEQFAF